MSEVIHSCKCTYGGLGGGCRGVVAEAQLYRCHSECVSCAPYHISTGCALHKGHRGQRAGGGLGDPAPGALTKTGALAQLIRPS